MSKIQTLAYINIQGQIMTGKKLLCSERRFTREMICWTTLYNMKSLRNNFCKHDILSIFAKIYLTIIRTVNEKNKRNRVSPLDHYTSNIQSKSLLLFDTFHNADKGGWDRDNVHNLFELHLNCSSKHHSVYRQQPEKDLCYSPRF